MAADRTQLPAIGPDPAFSFPRIERHTLANGIALRTVEHMSAPLVSFVVLVEGGSASDPAHLEGLAALTADMMDEGTGDLSAIDVSDQLARIGANYDSDVGADASTFTLTTLARHVERGSTLLADLLLRPSLRDADFDRVRKLRVDRLRQIRDLPQAVADRAMLRLLYGEHPYAHQPLGTSAGLARTSLDSVVAFHGASVQPASIIVVAGGALSHATLREVAERVFGAWQPAAPAPPAAPPASSIEPADAPRPRLAIVARPGAAQSELRIGHLSARRSTPDYASLLVANAVLGGQFVSRVNLKLREEKGYTYGARTGFDWRRGLAPFALHASVHTAATADAIRLSLEELEGIRGPRPPTAEEMELARASLTKGFPRNFETVQQVTRGVAQLALFDLPDTYFEEFIPRVHAVTSAEVVRVAREYIHPDRASTIIVGDRSVIEADLEALGLGAASVLDVET